MHPFPPILKFNKIWLLLTSLSIVFAIWVISILHFMHWQRFSSLVSIPLVTLMKGLCLNGEVLRKIDRWDVKPNVVMYKLNVW
jgi:hypothetical protein